jgi:hypothetical protein
METMRVMEIMHAVAEGRHDMDCALQEYLERSGPGEDPKLTWLLALFDVHQDQHALVDDFVMHTWKYIEKNPSVWQHRYPTVDELKGDIGYDETVLPCVVRQSGTM